MLNVGPRLGGVEDFEAFIEFANRVEMDDIEFEALRRAAAKRIPAKPFYVCTIMKSHVFEGKAKMVNTVLHNHFSHL